LNITGTTQWPLNLFLSSTPFWGNSSWDLFTFLFPDKNNALGPGFVWPVPDTKDWLFCGQPEAGLHRRQLTTEQFNQPFAKATSSNKPTTMNYGTVNTTS